MFQLRLQGADDLWACNLLQNTQKKKIQEHYAQMLKKYPPITTHWENVIIDDKVSVLLATNGIFSIHFSS